MTAATPAAASGTPTALADPAGVATQWGLEPLRGRPKLSSYLRQLWQRRWFVIELAKSRFRAQNEADRLGMAWLILLPSLNAAVYGLIFGVLMAGTRPKNFVPFLIIGVFIFGFFGACLAGGARAIHQNKGLVTSLHFPRAVLPLSVVVQECLALVWTTSAMIVFVLVLGERIHKSWLWLGPTLFLFAVFNAGVAFIAARATTKLRDIAQLVPFISRILFYLSGVFYQAHGINTHTAVGKIMEYNPISGFLTLCRVAIMGRSAIALPKGWSMYHTLMIQGIWAFGLLVVGFLWFWRAEEEYGRE